MAVLDACAFQDFKPNKNKATSEIPSAHPRNCIFNISAYQHLRNNFR